MYSGSLGYLSLDGSAALNIVIRSVVFQDATDHMVNLSIGSGGAVTALSEPAQEYEEMLLKSKRIIEAVEASLNGHKGVSRT